IPGWFYSGELVGIGARARQNTDRNEARNGAVRLEVDRTPATYQEFHVGMIAIHVAKNTRDHIHRKSDRASLKARTDADRIESLKQCLNCMVRKDPLIKRRTHSASIEQELRNRAHVIAHLFKAGAHYHRYEHWISHDPINTAAFKKLITEKQVWLIFTLLSGEDYAKFTALSLIQDPNFSLGELNTFMRAYIKFMQGHVDKSSTLGVQDARNQLMVDQIRWLTDISAGRVTQANTVTTQVRGDDGGMVDVETVHEVVETPGRMVDFLNQHARKSGYLIKALAGTLSIQDANAHNAVVDEYLKGGRIAEGQPVLERLRVLEQGLVAMLGDASIDSDIHHLAGHDAMLGLAGEHAGIRQILVSVAWLKSYYAAKEHCCTLLSVLESRARKNEILEDMLAVDSNAVLDAFTLDPANMQRLKHNMPIKVTGGTDEPDEVEPEHYTADLGLLSFLVRQPTPEKRQQLYRVIARLLTDDPHYKTPIHDFLQELSSEGALDDESLAELNKSLAPPDISPEERLNVARQLVLAITAKDNWGLLAKGHAMDTLYMQLFPEMDVFAFYRTLVNKAQWEDEPTKAAFEKAMGYLILYRQQQLGDTETANNVLHCLSAAGNVDAITPQLVHLDESFPAPEAEFTGANRHARMSCQLLYHWAHRDESHGDGQNYFAQSYLLHHIDRKGFVAPQVVGEEADEVNAFPGKTADECRQIRISLLMVLIRAIRVQDDRAKYGRLNEAFAHFAEAYPSLARHGDSAPARVLYELYNANYISVDEFYTFVKELSRHAFPQYMYSLVYVFQPVDALIKPLTLFLNSENDKARFRKAAEQLMDALLIEQAHGGYTLLLEQVRNAMMGWHPVSPRTYPDAGPPIDCRSRGLDSMMAALLQRCIANYTEDDGQGAAVIFNQLMSVYQQKSLLDKKAVPAKAYWVAFREFIADSINTRVAEFKIALLTQDSSSCIDDALQGCWLAYCQAPAQEEVDLPRDYIAHPIELRQEFCDDLDRQGCDDIGDHIRSFEAVVNGNGQPDAEYERLGCIIPYVTLWSEYIELHSIPRDYRQCPPNLYQRFKGYLANFVRRALDRDTKSIHERMMALVTRDRSVPTDAGDAEEVQTHWEGFCRSAMVLHQPWWESRADDGLLHQVQGDSVKQLLILARRGFKAAKSERNPNKKQAAYVSAWQVTSNLLHTAYIPEHLVGIGVPGLTAKRASDICDLLITLLSSEQPPGCVPFYRGESISDTIMQLLHVVCSNNLLEGNMLDRLSRDIMPLLLEKQRGDVHHVFDDHAVFTRMWDRLPPALSDLSDNADIKARFALIYMNYQFQRANRRGACSASFFGGGYNTVVAQYCQAMLQFLGDPNRDTVFQAAPQLRIVGESPYYGAVIEIPEGVFSARALATIHGCEGFKAWLPERINQQVARPWEAQAVYEANPQARPLLHVAENA
ncbi:MAG: hypothetical protein COB66_09545, partial [Coxiella sp. (in: Bacteria)]